MIGSARRRMRRGTDRAAPPRSPTWLRPRAAAAMLPPPTDLFIALQCWLMGEARGGGAAAERMEVLGVSHADRSVTMIDSNPPFFAAYGSLFHSRPAAGNHEAEAMEECDLPLVDLSRLSDEFQAEQCKREIVTAASVWGFFQIVNHGIPNGVLERLREEQVRMFRQPFEKKADEKFLGFLGDSYRWGAPTATSLKQLSWLEAYHIRLSSATYPATTSTSRYSVRCFSRVRHEHGYSCY
ncbi:hypothetical protein B296_00012668 [Ensete ventricosum]|uniref:Non-haem dioxygenase N-terminal domain-containing protein n=1 Tax=Ensete ventricosum TaxID=4639 RepID=A0A426ZPR5_ENSVE|nr:hypothetical protein B296_00012668 [Ensete ventricosum]